MRTHPVCKEQVWVWLWLWLLVVAVVVVVAVGCGDDFVGDDFVGVLVLSHNNTNPPLTSSPYNPTLLTSPSTPHHLPPSPNKQARLNGV